MGLTPQGASEGKSQFNFVSFYGKYGIVLILVIIVIIASLLSPNFTKVENITNVLRQVTVIIILGFGATFVLLVGEINIAYDSYLILIGCLSCSVMVTTGSVLLTILFAIALGLICASVFGYFVTELGLPSFIVSLAIATIGRGVVLLITNAGVITGLSDDFKFIGQGYIGFIPFPVLIMFFLLCITWFILSKTVFGRHVYAVGGNRVASEASGIRTKRVIMKVFLIDGILAGIAAIVYMSRLGSGQPNSGVGSAFDAITAVILGGASLSGGIGHVYGTVIGAFIVGVINNIMNLLNINSYWQLIAKGSIILIAVVIDVKSKKGITSKA